MLRVRLTGTEILNTRQHAACIWGVHGRSLAISKWLASSSKPHWQMMSVAPLSLQHLTMSVK